MGAGQKMNLYWPVPSDAKSNSEFHIIHFKGIDRDSNADVNELLTTRIPEKLTCETVTIGGQKFVKFAVDSFSPFALLYEKDTSTPTQPSGGGGSSSGSGGGGGGKTAVAVKPLWQPLPTPRIAVHRTICPRREIPRTWDCGFP